MHDMVFALSRRGERAKHKKQDYVVQSLFLILNQNL